MSQDAPPAVTVVPSAWLPMLREAFETDDAGLRSLGFGWDTHWPRGWNPNRKFRISMR